MAIKLAAVQASPVFLDKTASTQKACELIKKAGFRGADVIGFPEGFIPGFPGWFPFLSNSDPLVESLYLQLFNNAVEVPGPEVELLQNACREGNIYAVVGINERRSDTTGTLYNTQITIGRDGTLLHKHQKYVPTVGERMIHAPGTTGSKTTVQTDFGGLSGLLCGENGNPLGQYSTALDHPVVHVASWPQFLTFGLDLEHFINTAGKAVAFSVGTYVINAAAVVADSEIEAYGIDERTKDFMRTEQKKRRASIFAPGGGVVAGSLDDEIGEDLLFADVDLDAVKRYKHTFDFAGHYNRPEIFAHHFKKYLS
jgi:nitrilase